MLLPYVQSKDTVETNLDVQSKTGLILKPGSHRQDMA